CNCMAMRIWSSKNWRLLSKRGETSDFAPPAMRIESAWKTWIRLSSLRNAGSKRASKHQITTASQVYISRGELKCMIFCIHAPLNTDGQGHGPQARALDHQYLEERVCRKSCTSVLP